MPRKMLAVVLVGRPNVGKSTLFNKITGHRRAIVAPVAGTTRDSLSRPAVWQGRSFQLFDTGGLYGASEDPLHELVVEHGKRAIVGADLLVLVVDGRDGLVSGDETIARELREAGRPLILAINKIDDKRARHATMDFYRLGIEPIVEISAEHGTGVGDLLDEIVKAIGIRDSGFGIRDVSGAESQTPNPESRDEISVAIVGRPNVGKSSLVKEHGPDFCKRFDDATRRHMRLLDYAPILHISALTGERAPKVLETIDKIAEARRTRVPTPALNKFVEAVTAANPPVSPGRRHVRILYAAQIGVAPPSFVFFTNVATTFHFSYQRFLINKLREAFGFFGTPIRIQVRRREKKGQSHR